MADTEGLPHDLDAALARGERVVLLFWQTWCEASQEQSPAIVSALSAHGSELRFFGVVAGSHEIVGAGEVQAMREDFGYTNFPQLRDLDSSWTRAFGAQRTPTILILGAGREVLYQGPRPPRDWKRFYGSLRARLTPSAQPRQAPRLGAPASAPSGGVSRS